MKKRLRTTALSNKEIAGEKLVGQRKLFWFNKFLGEIKKYLGIFAKVFVLDIL